MRTHDTRSKIRRSPKAPAPSLEKAVPGIQEAVSTETDWDAGQILQLQRLVGNKAVHRMLNERTVQRESHGKGCNCASCSSMQRQTIQRVDEHEEDIQAMRIQRVDEHEEDIQAMRIQRVEAHRIQRDGEDGSGATTTTEATPEPGVEHGPLTLLDTVKDILKTVTDLIETVKNFLKSSWNSTIANDDAMKEIAAKIGAKDFMAAGRLFGAPLKQQLEVVIKYWTPVSLADIKPSIEAAPQDERDIVWKDGTLMGELKTKLGDDDYLDMQPVLAVFKDGVTTEDNKSHTRADKADEYIRDHLSAFVGEAVKAGRQVQGQVAVVDGTEWADAYFREFGNDGEEDNTNAFVDKKNLIWVHKTRGNAGTIIHEGVHKYALDNFLNEVGFDFNEGITEYFTRKVTDALSYTRGNYEDNYLFAKEFAALIGDDKLAKGYFDGAVQDVIDEYEKDGKVWADLKAATASEDWVEAVNLVTS